jgi:hypothetical protein
MRSTAADRKGVFRIGARLVLAHGPLAAAVSEKPCLEPMAPGGIEPPHADSKSAALSTELRGRSQASMPPRGVALRRRLRRGLKGRAGFARAAAKPGLRGHKRSEPRGWVAEGTRTPDHRDHNPGLYQLSYRHRAAGTG